MNADELKTDTNMAHKTKDVTYLVSADELKTNINMAYKVTS